MNKDDGICFFNENGELDGTKIIKVEKEKVFPGSMKGITLHKRIYRNFDYKFNKKLMSKDIERKILINADLLMNRDYIHLKISDLDGNTAEVGISGDFVCPKNPELAYSTIHENLCKTGGSEFKIKNLNVDKNKVLFIPVSILNELRRKAIEELRLVREKTFVRKTRDKEIIFSKYPIQDLDYKANVYNSNAESFYKKCGSNVSQMAAESSLSFIDKDLMTSKHCIKYTLKLCKKYFKNVTTYKEPLLLFDENGSCYKLFFDCKNCIMTLKQK